MSIPAVKAIEFGSGLSGTLMTGSQHNDAFTSENGEISTSTNRSGGIQRWDFKWRRNSDQIELQAHINHYVAPKHSGF